jgi:hypothetical protein
MPGTSACECREGAADLKASGGTLGDVYSDRGETMLKGFEDAVRLYEVRWRE